MAEHWCLHRGERETWVVLYEDLGIYTADIYWSQWKDSMWSKAKSQGANVNTEWDEESVGITALGDKVFVYFETIDVFGDLAASTIKGKMWQKTGNASTAG